MKKEERDSPDSGKIGFDHHSKFYERYKRLHQFLDPAYRQQFISDSSSLLEEYLFISRINDELHDLDCVVRCDWIELEPSQFDILKQWHLDLASTLTKRPHAVPWFKNKELLKRLCLKCGGRIDEDRVIKGQGQAKLCAQCKQISHRHRNRKYRQNNKDSVNRSNLKYLKSNVNMQISSKAKKGASS